MAGKLIYHNDRLAVFREREIKRQLHGDCDVFREGGLVMLRVVRGSAGTGTVTLPIRATLQPKTVRRLPDNLTNLLRRFTLDERYLPMNAVSSWSVALGERRIFAIAFPNFNGVVHIR